MPIPVSLDDAKLHLRHAGEDLSVERNAEIEGFIADAAAWVEGHTGHILEARDVTEEFGQRERLWLRAWPIKPSTVPEVVFYVDGAGSAMVLADARLNMRTRPARVDPLGRWPWSVYGAPVSVTVRAGYEPGDTVPGNIRRAMLILIAAYDADREGGDLFAKAERAACGLCRNLRPRRV